MRAYLKYLVVIFALAGIAVLIYLFGSSLKVNSKARNEAWLEFSVEGMEFGEAKKFHGWYYVYKLSNAASNPNKQYLIFHGVAPARLCDIEYIPPGKREYISESRKKFMNKPHFSEPCERGIWDMEGNYINGTGRPGEQNLYRYEYKVSKSGSLLVNRAPI